ncbi:MAG: hypothetical protein PHN57_08130, partial [Candidatus Omnitrophica bacterium]|nr:hypothetical protein [Candidatus Omnitrophota bacterium]
MKSLILAIFILVSCVSYLSAMEPDLWQIPQPPDAIYIVKDKPVEINHIVASGSHLRSNMPKEEILAFYKDALLDMGWKPDANLTEEVTSFVKGERFMYVGILETDK